MVKHNNVIPNGHFHKEWQMRIRTWLDQPARKKARRAARAAKAAAIAPRPAAGALRPAVHCQTVRYNRRVRAGRGFSLDELKAAGVSELFARSVGIAVDHRRKNRSVEALDANVQRLKAYVAKLVVFPRGKVAKRGDASAAEVAAATQFTGSLAPAAPAATAVVFEKLTADLKSNRAFATIRQERSNLRRWGERKARAEGKGAEEAAPQGKVEDDA